MQKSRREFIQGSLASSALLPLGACTTLDRWVLGDFNDEDDKILIIGAGLAGLSAAYHLKKNQVPFRLFEGSDRVGGRVVTLRDLNISSRHAELGPTRIELEHTAIQSMIQELKLSLLEVSAKEGLAWFEKGKFLSSKEWQKEAPLLQKLFQTVQKEAYGNLAHFLEARNKDQFPKAVLLDRMSAAELLDRLQSQFRPWMKPFLEQVIRSEWGVEPSEISSLHLVHWMRDSFQVTSKKYFKISGGTSVLTQALYDRVGGVIPDRFVKFDHRLLAIRPKEKGWELVFQTPGGRINVLAQKIICTLPPALLRQVDGWEQLPFSDEKKKLLAEQNLGSHGKVVLGFQDRFWQESPVLGSGGTVYTDQPMASMTEAGDPVVSGLNSLHGLLEIQMGGQAGVQAGLHSIQQALKDLQKVYPQATTFENISYVQNWKLQAWAKGSRAYLKPGQFQGFDSNLIDKGWAFAGDWHSLQGLGTMNGAVQTGIEAANRFFKTSV